jgi:nicotinate-nucleotide adenylyltransferase
LKIGLFFGSFNPIHVGHLIIANHIAEHTELDEVWLVVTPHNPLKEKSTLLSDYHRFEMVYQATQDYPKLKPSDIEFKLKQPNYTVVTLAHLQEKYPNHQFSLIMGADNLQSLHKWKNYEMLLANYPIYVYPRIGVENIKTFDVNSTIHMVAAPIVEISSTFIRNEIKNHKNIKPLLPEAVWKYIDHNNFYKR